MHIDLGLSAPLLVFDVETLPNFTSVVVRSVNDPAPIRDRFFSNYPGLGEPFAALRELVQTPALWVGYNILNFDCHVMRAIIRDGVDDAGQLKALANSVIESPDRRLYDFGGDEICVDLFILYKGVHGRVGSLKRVACHLDIEEFSEMPYAHDHYVADLSEGRVMLRYNRLDVHATELMLESVQEMLRIRIALVEEYGLDLSVVLNSADSKLAEEVLARLLFDGARPQWSRYGTWSISGADITAGFAFSDPDLIALRDRIATWQMDYSQTRAPRKDGGRGDERKIVRKPHGEIFKAFGVTIKAGMGGIHSQDPAGIIEADATWAIWDYDVRSFYPMLMLVNQWAPSHLDRDAFVAALQGIITARLAAKDAGNKLLATALKISVNSIFGKTSSAYSWLLDPVLTALVCITGELILLQATERLVAVAGADVSVLSMNTDGATIRCRRCHAAAVTQAMADSIHYYGMEIETVEYAKIWRRDGNSYIALPTPTPDDPAPAAKCRGDYGYDRSNLEKSPVRRIVVDAVQRHWLAGVDVESTIMGCTDIREFLDFTSTKRVNVLVDDAGNELGQVCRWYRATAGIALKVRVRATGKESAHPLADRIRIVGDLPASMPGDVDRAIYIEEARSLIAAVENPVEKKAIAHQIAVEDLSVEQRTWFVANAECETADMVRCNAFDLTKYHAAYEQMVKGNRWATMSHVVWRIWVDGKGELTRGDLRELVERVVGFDWSGNDASKVDSAVMHNAYLVSPFPKPRSRSEIIEAALTWAREHVNMATRKRKLYHHGIQNTNYVTGTTVNRYLRNHDPYPLACAICATFVKYGLEPDRDFIGRIMDDVIAVEHVELH